METLYKMLDNKSIQTWRCDNLGNSFATTEGILDGKLTTAVPTVCLPKNIGKKNFLTAEQQCKKEILAKYTLKLNNGYFRTIEEAKADTTFAVMLAHKYQDNKDKVVFPCHIQTKIDGVRCYINKNGMFTRKNKVITSCPHIFNSCKGIFEKCPDLVLDGELYNHDLKHDFNKIISLVRKVKLSTEELEESRKLVQYHLYDCYRGKPESFLQRLNFNYQLCKFFRPEGFHLVDTHIVSSHEQVMEKHKEYTKLGYEGSIIRQQAEYQQKRTRDLLKLKDFQDEEFLITGILEGIGGRSGMMGEIVCITKEGEEFSADGSGLGGHEFYRELLQNKENYIGKMATVEFQNYTPERNVPRFAKVKAIDRASVGDI